MRDTLLITGGSSLLGVNWGLIERARYHVVLGLHERRITLSGTESRFIQVKSTEHALSALDAFMPSLVVHTAGLTSVETCEAYPQLAKKINVEMAGYVARACAQRQVPLVHISTDHLFKGDSPFADEGQPISPLNVYASTKAAAEVEVMDSNPKALVVRTNFYGWGPGYRQSFSDRIIIALRSGVEITLFKDVFFTPILIETLVFAVNQLVRVGAAGIFNVVGDERLSKYEFGLAIAQKAGLDPNLIKVGSILDRQELVARPLDMSLDNTKTCSTLGRKLGIVKDEIARLLQQENMGFATEIQKI